MWRTSPIRVVNHILFFVTFPQWFFVKAFSLSYRATVLKRQSNGNFTGESIDEMKGSETNASAEDIGRFFSVKLDSQRPAAIQQAILAIVIDEAVLGIACRTFVPDARMCRLLNTGFLVRHEGIKPNQQGRTRAQPP